MAQIPFVVSVRETVANGGTISHEYKAPNNQAFLIHEIFFVVAAAFNIIRIQDDAGRYYSFISTNDPIPSSALRVASTNVNLLMLPKVPLLLRGGTTLTIELLDTGGGGANTVILNGELSVPD